MLKFFLVPKSFVAALLVKQQANALSLGELARTTKRKIHRAFSFMPEFGVVYAAAQTGQSASFPTRKTERGKQR